jgi:hypothetical protein
VAVRETGFLQDIWRDDLRLVLDIWEKTSLRQGYGSVGGTCPFTAVELNAGGTPASTEERAVRVGRVLW